MAISGVLKSSSSIDLGAALSGNVGDVCTSSGGDIIFQTGFGAGGGGSGVTWSGTGMESTLTIDEAKQLDILKKDRDLWLKQEKLKAFQKLPNHLRQDIVDEACIVECIKDMSDIDVSKFDKNDEIYKLESKNGYYLAIDNATYHTYPHNSKYPVIIGALTRDELVDAHAAITLEENLGDSDGL